MGVAARGVDVVSGGVLVAAAALWSLNTPAVWLAG